MRCCSSQGPSSCSSEDQPEWLQVRRYYLRNLRYQTKSIILLLGLREAIKYGPMRLVYAGREGYPPPGEQDYGIAYTTAYIISYIYLCAFMIIFIPFFSWWLPSGDSSSKDKDCPSLLAILAKWFRQFNLIWLPFCTAIGVVLYVLNLFEALVYVDERRTHFFQKPKTNAKTWKVRALLISTILTSLALGYGAVQVLEMMELAHIKPYEYALIVVPFHINIGVVVGTRVQRKIEKRVAMKLAARETNVEEQGSQQPKDVADEKMRLL